MESSIYKIISEHDFLAIPIANSMAGAAGFGFKGLMIGMSLGVLDEVLLKSGVTNTRYLSPIFQGASSFAIHTTSYTVRGLGGILGFMFSKFTMSEYVEYSNKITSPIQSSLQLGCVFGYKGIILGAVLGIVEEVAMHHKIYDRHYITTTISFFSFTHLIRKKFDLVVGEQIHILDKFFIIKNLLHKNPYIFYAIGSIFSCIKLTYENKKEYEVTVVQLQKEIGEVYRKLGQEKEYRDILEKQVITSLGLAVVEQYLFFKKIQSLQKLYESFYGDLLDSVIWQNFKAHLKNIIWVFPGQIMLKQIFITPFEAYFNFKAQNQLYDVISSKWLIGETPLKLTKDTNIEVLIDNLSKDIEILINKGENLRKSFCNEVIKSSYGQYLMYKYNVQDLILTNQLYYSFTQYIFEKFSEWQLFYSNKLRELETIKSSILKHDARNIETVVERNGFEYSEIVLKEINDEIRIITTSQMVITNLKGAWKDIELYLGIIFTFFLIGFKTNTGKLQPDKRLEVLAATETISPMLGWQGKKSGEITEVKNSIMKLSSFINKIQAIGDENSNNLQQIGYVGKEIIFENFQLTAGSKELLYVENLELKPNLYYALTGDSGSGKSSFLSKIKGITYNGIIASGSIKYPSDLNKQNIVFMSQKDFFPINTTLVQAIYYPKYITQENNKEISSKIYQMLQDIDICSDYNELEKECIITSQMNEKKDWESILSGGQKKKALIVSMLLKKADMYLLDEPFTGIHKEGIVHVQTFIKHHLQNKNMFIICIDHHLSDSKNFYDFELRIQNRSLVIQDFLNEDDIMQIQQVSAEENNYDGM